MEETNFFNIRKRSERRGMDVTVAVSAWSKALRDSIIRSSRRQEAHFVLCRKWEREQGRKGIRHAQFIAHLPPFPRAHFRNDCLEPPYGRVAQITRIGWTRPRAVLKSPHSKRFARFVHGGSREAFGVRASLAPLFARPARARFGQHALNIQRSSGHAPLRGDFVP